MKKIEILAFVLNVALLIGSVIRLCSGAGVAYDYVVICFSLVILPYDIVKFIKHYRNKKGCGA